MHYLSSYSFSSINLEYPYILNNHFPFLTSSHHTIASNNTVVNSSSSSSSSVLKRENKKIEHKEKEEKLEKEKLEEEGEQKEENKNQETKDQNLNVEIQQDWLNTLTCNLMPVWKAVKIQQSTDKIASVISSLSLLEPNSSTSSNIDKVTHNNNNISNTIIISTEKK